MIISKYHHEMEYKGFLNNLLIISINIMIISKYHDNIKTLDNIKIIS